MIAIAMYLFSLREVSCLVEASKFISKDVLVAEVEFNHVRRRQNLRKACSVALLWP